MSGKRRTNFLRSVPFGPQPPSGGDELRAEYWRRSCFYSSPIGRANSDERQHADMLQKSLVTPAIEELDPEMTVVRADELASSSISASVIEHVLQSRLLIADLSFHNPNVLYEVGMRHGKQMPFVLISRFEDPIPSNLRDSRVVRLNTGHAPTFVSEMANRMKEITEYARSALYFGGEDGFPHRSV